MKEAYAWGCTDLRGLLQQHRSPLVHWCCHGQWVKDGLSAGYFFHALLTLNVKGHSFHRKIFVLFLCFLEAGNQKGLPFPQACLGHRRLLRSVGKSNRCSIICVLYAAIHIIPVLPCLRQNTDSHHTKAGIPDILGFSSRQGGGVLFCFLCVTRFQCRLAMCFPSNAKSIAGQVDF